MQYGKRLSAGGSAKAFGLATALGLATVLGLGASNVQAASIIDQWANVKAPAAPELKPVTVDPKTTALLMLDFLPPNCGHSPRCTSTLPAVKKLLGEARKDNMLVIYTAFGKFTQKDVLADVAPNGSEPFVATFLNKYIGTDLQKILKDKGITTVITVGSAANGAVLTTAGASAEMGFNVIVPLDGMSSDDAYAEQYTAYHLTHAPVIPSKITLTTIDQMKF